MQGGFMRVFASLLVLLGVFVYLPLHFSFWVVFGGMYMIGMIVIVLIACFGKHRTSTQLARNESFEKD
jgi:ABC-type protease/lipase transport system fused ATPase/permease subunit